MVNDRWTAGRRGVAGLVLTLGSLSLSAATAQAQGGAPTTSQSPAGSAQPGSLNQPGGINSSLPEINAGSQASAQDREFLHEAAQGNNFEIKAAQLAIQKSSSADVKKFAQEMIDGHTKLGNEMKPIASEAGVVPPTGLSRKDKAVYEKLQGLSGDDFDKAYIQEMVKDHSMDLKAFQTEASNGQLASEKNAASQGTSVVQTHLQHVQQLAQAHNVAPSGT